MDSDSTLEDLMGQIGDWGKYQFRQHMLHLLSGFLAGVHMLSLTTVAPTPPHRCFIEELDFPTVNMTSLEVDAELQNYIPIYDGHLQSCWKKDFRNNETINCEGRYTYDTIYYKDSKVMDWGLVCDKRWERAMMQSIYMFGVLLGAIILGPMADKCGRKTIFYISGLLQLVSGLACAFVSNFVLYCGCLFFYGMFGSGGAYVTGFVLSMELIGPRKRTICGTMFSAAFALGVVVVAFWGYMIPNATMLQVVYSLHALTLVFHWWLIDESIRWLWGQGRKAEAIKIVQKATKINGVPFDASQYEDEICQTGKKLQEEKSGLMDLFKTPRLLTRALIVAFCWFANSIVYYGLSWNTDSLVGNPYLMLCLIGLAEFPGYAIVVLLVDKTGRRSLCSSLMLVGGFCCIFGAFIPKGTFVTVLVMIGKMSIASSFAIAYNYTAELFPTVVRNSAVGLGAMAARFSGLLTPLLGLLDSLDKRIPTIIFGTVAITSALLTLFLPETVNTEMQQTIEDGENFGRGDTGYRTFITCCNRRSKSDPEQFDITHNNSVRSNGYSAQGVE